MNIEIIGKTFAYFETGTEGILWAVQDDNYPHDYKGLHILKDGYHLTIYDKLDEIWSGLIDLDWIVNKVSINPYHTQQNIDGYWIHGIQRHVDPSTWLQYFQKEYTAKLTYNEKD